MADIFISYSSKDRAQAEQLTELLASAGLSVWIDRQGIGAATSWSAEIYDAIETCTALVVMLSPSSIESKNVAREVALAFEKNKKILPLDLEPVALTRDFGYHLAGLQRTPMTNIDAIIRALGKLGLEATGAPTVKLVNETDARKSLMILPFEDLSPTGDNGWFADGIVSELISSLSHVKAVRITDAQTTKEFKNFKGQLTSYARTMSIRYFVQGDVRKFGDAIKVSARLLDIETGDHLWEQALKGTMADVFDFQERVAESVLQGLKVHLTKEEQQRLTDIGTENPEAYEFTLRGLDYHRRHTKADYEHAVRLWEEAIALDPGYARAYGLMVNTLQAIYRNYHRNPVWLDRAEHAALRLRELEGESAQYAWVMAALSLQRGDTQRALTYAQRSIQLDPEYAVAYDILGFVYKALNDPEGAIQARREYLRLRDVRSAHFNYVSTLNELGNTPSHREELRQAAEAALKIMSRHCHLNPDDYNARAQFALTFAYAGRSDEALKEADMLASNETMDGGPYYNLGCVYAYIGETARAFAMLRKAIDTGTRNLEDFRRDSDLASIRELPEFVALVRELEEKIEKEKHG